MRLSFLRSCVLIVLLSGQQAIAPYKICNENTEYSHGQLCCRKCPAGTYLEDDCLQDHGAANCTKCPPGTYTTYNNHMRGCLRCHIPCNPLFGFVEIIDCQPHHNRQCRCKKGTHRLHEVCVLDQKPCPPGQGVVKKGSLRSHPVCEDCPPGTFSSKPSLTKACRTWRNCAALGLETKTGGTSTRNAKCGGPLVPQQTEPVTSAIPVMPVETSEAAITSVTTASPAVNVTTTAKPPQTTPDESTTAEVTTEKDDTSLRQVPKDQDNSNNIINHHSLSAQMLVLIFIGAAILLIIVIALVWKKVKKQRRRRRQDDVTPKKVHVGPAREQLLDPQDAQDPIEEGVGMGGLATAEDQGQLNIAQGAGDVHGGTVQPYAGRPAANQPLQPAVDATLIRMQEGTAHVDARRQLVIYSQSTTIQQQNDFGSPNYVQVGQGNEINVGRENGVAQAEQSDEE